MKVLILGASGIIGQHLRLCVPQGIEPIWARRTADRLHLGVDLENDAEREAFLEAQCPQVVINLAGESNTDAVERDPARYERINVEVPKALAAWCCTHGTRFIHMSTQAVYGGPVNAYGRQKLRADEGVLGIGFPVVIRPTFVLGVRPLPNVGRANPVEQMLSGQWCQVSDRWFSPLFASDAAKLIWAVVQYDVKPGIVHFGNPRRVSRFDVAKALGIKPIPCSHDDFPGIAPRPVDTTYSPEVARFISSFDDGIWELQAHWRQRVTMDISERAREIAMFLGMSEEQAKARLSLGFGALHGKVAEDYRRANPRNDTDLLEWYRKTEAYIWELSAYHADQGFNYSGMCRGIAERLKTGNVKRVLCLGDGIGDLTLTLHRAGFYAVYHDLADSRTAEFAKFRFWMHTGTEMPCELTDGWAPEIGCPGTYDAVVSLDFLEHVTDVPAWVEAAREALVPGGLLMTQNAFGVGSGQDGSIPMHLAVNDRFEKDWDPLLTSLNFRQESSNWYVKAA